MVRNDTPYALLPFLARPHATSVGAGLAAFFSVNDTTIFAAAHDAALDPAPAKGPDAPLFDLASLTKPLYVTALATLAVERHLAAPDKPLADDIPALHYIPALRDFPALRDITLAALLNHTAGFSSWASLAELPALSDPPHAPSAPSATDSPEQTSITVPHLNHQTIAYLAAHHRDPHMVGTTRYSDLGYITLALALDHLLASATGERPYDLWQREFVAASGLTNRDIFAPSSEPAPFVAAMRPRTIPGEFRLAKARCDLCEVNDDNARLLDARLLDARLLDARLLATPRGYVGHAGLFGTAHAVARLALTVYDRARAAMPALFLAAEADPAAHRFAAGFDTPTGPTTTAGDTHDLTLYGHLGFTGTAFWLAPTARAVAVLLTHRIHPFHRPVAPLNALRRAFFSSCWRKIVGEHDKSRVNSSQP